MISGLIPCLATTRSGTLSSLNSLISDTLQYANFTVLVDYFDQAVWSMLCIGTSDTIPYSMDTDSQASKCGWQRVVLQWPMDCGHCQKRISAAANHSQRQTFISLNITLVNVFQQLQWILLTFLSGCLWF